MACHAGRVRRALVAWAASAAVLFASAAPLVAGHLAVDRDCAPSLVESHDHAAHRLSQQAEPLPDHCAACHLTRSVRGASFGQSLLARGWRHTTAIQPHSAAPYRTDLRTDPTRGPPR